MGVTNHLLIGMILQVVGILKCNVMVITGILGIFAKAQGIIKPWQISWKPLHILAS